MKKIFLSTASAMMPLFLIGCGGVQQHEKEIDVKPEVVKQYTQGKPKPLQRFYARIPKEGDRNAVLNQNRIGLAAFELGEYKLAGEAFDNSITRVESIYADNEEANKARSLWFKENAKDYKGEGYERAMLYYYRGLTYLAKGDYENARASFKSGMIQDSFAENEKYRADFASLAFLEGWTSQCLENASQATEKYTEATSLNKQVITPNAQDNVLVIYEAGTAPVKQHDAKNMQALVYKQGEAPTLTVSTATDTSSKALFQAEDIYWQATTRGGREIDKVLEGKANFKETASKIGDVALTTSTAGLTVASKLYEQGNDDIANTVGITSGVGSVIGLFAKVADGATQIDADTRYWDNLPNNLYIATTELPKTVKSLPITSTQGEKSSTSNMKILWGKGCGVAWGRQVSSLSVPDSAANAIAK